MKIFPTRKSPLYQGTNVNSTYYKNPKTLTNQGTHNFPSSSTLELWKFSDLIFGGYLAGTTPILSTRFSLFLFCKCYLEHVRTVWLTDDFRHHHNPTELDTLDFVGWWVELVIWEFPEEKLACEQGNARRKISNPILVILRITITLSLA